MGKKYTLKQKAGSRQRLLSVEDLKGDLHVHSNWSDGAESIEEIAHNYMESGYEYIAICDHSRLTKPPIGLDAAGFEKQQQEINRINGHAKGTDYVEKCRF